MKIFLVSPFQRSFLFAFVAFLFLLGLIQTPASALQSTNKAEIDFGVLDSFVEAQMKKHNYKGISIAIVQGDEIIYAKGYGTAGNHPMTPQTPMYIGSTSKTFTALAIAQLAEQGRLELNAPVRTYLPWFRVADEEASQKLTVRHFLHHATGLSDAGFDVLPSADSTTEQAVRALGTARLTAPVGKESMYFNANYQVLALIIEQISGQTYPEYIEENIFAPIRMTHSFTSPEEVEGLAQGYSRFLGFPIKRSQPFRKYDLATGYLISSAEDLARFLTVMNTGGKYKESSILSPQGVQRLHSPRPQAGFQYGMGWFVSTRHNLKRVDHGGALESFKSHMALYPTRDTGLVILINQGYLADAYISHPQLFFGIEDYLMTGTAPDASAGAAMTVYGGIFFVFFTGLSIFMVWQLLRLPGWPAKARKMKPVRRIFDAALNFMIPLGILMAVMMGLSSFFGYRFNLLQQLQGMFVLIPDMILLLFVGTVPDLVQGVVKTWWLVSGKIDNITEAPTSQEISPI